jgi:hypothetical protein
MASRVVRLTLHAYFVVSPKATKASTIRRKSIVEPYKAEEGSLQASVGTAKITTAKNKRHVHG